jgi:inhibitor of KinA sporulation pathway (predicted exonuclease)
MPDKIVVVDIEATCWRGQPPDDQVSEIIEVGVCLLDIASMALSDKRSILVRPVRSRVSAYCTRLTTLTQQQVDQGVTFAEACTTLERDYLTRERPWASWGDYDRRIFQEQAKTYDVRYPFSDQHLNVKQLYAEFTRLTRPVGMARALKMSDLVLEGIHHRGDDDAWNIGRLLALLLRRYGQDVLKPR